LRSCGRSICDANQKGNYRQIKKQLALRALVCGLFGKGRNATFAVSTYEYPTGLLWIKKKMLLNKVYRALVLIFFPFVYIL
jgi:hypothetical protein